MSVIKMAEAENPYVMQSGFSLQGSSSYFNENCVNCTSMNERYHEVLMELKSLRLITNTLQEEIKSLQNQHEDNTRCENKKSSEVQCSSDMSEQVIRESSVPQWSEVAAGKGKTRPHTRYNDAKPIPVIHNRYEVLNNYCINEQANSYQIKRRTLGRNCKTKSDRTTKRKRKILIIGDSHARGIASEIQHNLDDGYEVQGIVKPGSDLETITTTIKKETNTLTKQDAVIVWGGIRDISRNESQKGLRQLRNFVEKHNQTNVLVMNVPNRFDLEAHSCVNHEVNTFNRKLDKHIKNLQHASTVEVTSNRELFTKHGLHLNNKGKEQMAKTIASSIKEIFKLIKKNPIKMSWKEEHELEEPATVPNKADKGDDQLPYENQEHKEDNLPTKRSRRLPTTRHADFLWLDINTNQ